MTQINHSQTPYFTAPLSPIFNTEFFQAVQSRHSSAPPFVSTNASEQAQSNPRCLKDTLPTLHLGNKSSLRRDDFANNQHSPTDSMTPEKLYKLLPTSDFTSSSHKLLLLDVRSFVQYSHSHIRTAIGVSVPTTILKRPTFTLEKLSETIVKDDSKKRLQSWQQAEIIVLYDQNSYTIQDASTMQHLFSKFQRQGFKGQIAFLHGKLEFY